MTPDENGARRAMALGKAAIKSGDRATALGVIDTLRDLIDAGLPTELVAEVQTLVNELLDLIRATAPQDKGSDEVRREWLEKNLEPCARCGGCELHVSLTRAELHVSRANPRRFPAWLSMTMIVCGACGDTRFVTESPSPKNLPKLRDQYGDRLFTTIQARGNRRGPFR
jgi:hypothetical protein